MPPSPHRDLLVQLIVAHMRGHDLADGRCVCSCKRHFENDRAHAVHVAEMVIDAFGGVLQQERVEGQLVVLAAAMRYFGPGETGTTARSRAVYTGAQFAGWCRERASSLRRTSGQGKPPT